MDANELKAVFAEALKAAGLTLVQDYDYDDGYSHAVRSEDGTTIDLLSLFDSHRGEWPRVNLAEEFDLEQHVGEIVLVNGLEHRVERAAE